MATLPDRTGHSTTVTMSGYYRGKSQNVSRMSRDLIPRNTEYDSRLRWIEIMETMIQRARIDDGDEIMITLQKTGRRPFEDRKLILVSEETYRREEDAEAKA